MDILKESALAFQALFNTQYNIILGRKNQLFYRTVIFRKVDFHHLIGLQYLRDLPYLKADREKIFDQIINNQITYANIQKSEFLPEIEDRISIFPKIQELLDSQNLMFKYNEKAHPCSKIVAAYLLKIDYESNDVYFFIDYLSCLGMYYGKSFFRKAIIDYTEGLPYMAILYIEKYNTTTDKSIIMQDKLSTKYQFDKDYSTGLFAFYKTIQQAAPAQNSKQDR